MSSIMRTGLVLAALSVSVPALAQTSRPTSRPSSRPTTKRRSDRAKKKVVPASVSEKNSLRLLTKMIWHSSLETAKARAKKEKKLIFWMHAVGDLSDKL